MKTAICTCGILITAAFAGTIVQPAFARPKFPYQLSTPDISWREPKYAEFSLPNGLAGFVVENAEVPLADYYIRFTAPADPPDRVGLGEIAAWTLRNGGGVDLPTDSLNDLIEFRAASLSIYADDEAVTIWGSCLSADLELMLAVTAELLRRPAYPPEMIEHKRGTMLEDIRRKNDSPFDISRREINRLLYPDHPRGREATESTVQAITREDLLAYHRDVFQPTGAVIGFSGDVHLPEVRELAAKYLGGLTSTGKSIATLPREVSPAAPGIYYFYKRDAKQAFVVAGHLSIDYSSPYRISGEIMNYILGGGGFQSRLTKRIRVDEGLAYSTGSRLTTPVSYPGYFRASFSTRFEQSGRALALMKDIIRAYAEEGPTREEFERAKEAFIKSYVWEFENASDVLAKLVYYKWRGLPLDTPQRDLKAYQALTWDEVKAAARELLHPDSLIVVVVGDRDKMDRPLEDFGPVFNINPGGNRTN